MLDTLVRLCYIRNNNISREEANKKHSNQFAVQPSSTSQAPQRNQTKKTKPKMPDYYRYNNLTPLAEQTVVPQATVLSVVDPDHPVIPPAQYGPPKPKFNLRRLVLLSVAGLTAVSLIGVAAYVIMRNQKEQTAKTAPNYAVTAIPLSDVSPEAVLGLAQIGRVDLNGTTKINGALILGPQQAPANPVTGQIYVSNNNNQPYYYDGTSFNQLVTSNQIGTTPGGTTTNVTNVTNTTIVNNTTAGQDLSIPISVANGGIGLAVTPANGQLLIGNGTGYNLNNLTAGVNIAITNTPGGITITGTGSGTLNSIGVLDSQPKSANGASVSGTSIYMQTADATNPGLISTTAQTLAGDKTFTGNTSTFKNNTDSTTAFQVQNAGGTSILNVDSAGQSVNVGAAAEYSYFSYGGGSFGAPTDYPSSDYPTGLATADVNNDGKPDIISGNRMSVGVLINNGDATFAPEVLYGSFNYAVRRVTTADVNRDGWQDIIVSNGASSASVLLNNGNGTFAPQVTYVTGPNPRGVTTADVNRDGWPDIITANDDTASVLINNGDGTFASKVDYLIGGSYGLVGIITADVNGDGWPDIITNNNETYNGNTAVLLNNGDGTFAPKVDYPAVHSIYSVTTADVNGDSKPDIIVGAESGFVVLINIGNGTFAPAVLYSNGAAYGTTDQVTTADVNGDGWPDVITSAPSVYMNNANGTGTFAPKTDLGGSRGFPSAADLNGDFKPDIVIRCEGSVSVFLNGISLVTVDANISATVSDINKSGFILQATSGQVADSFRVQDSTGSSLLNVAGNGNIGVGTNTPLAKLHVAGDVLFRNETDSAAAFQIQNAAGITGFNYSTNDKILSVIGKSNPSNGSSWSLQNTPTNNWQAITHGNGLYVAVSHSNTGQDVMTSPDGINWTPRTTPGSNWNNITYGNGVFVAVSDNGAGSDVMSSTDGKNWTIRTTPAGSWKSVTYDGLGRFVAVSSSGTNKDVMLSTNGINWFSQITPTGGGQTWQSITYGNGMFVAVSNSGTAQDAMTSPDGVAWTLRTTPNAHNWNSIAFGGGQFVAVSSTGAQAAMTSPDGINWTLRNTPSTNWLGITYGNNKFVAVGNNANQAAMTSPDGIAWTSQTTPANTAYSIVYGNGIFAAVTNVSGQSIMLSGSYSTALNVVGDTVQNGNVTVKNTVDSTSAFNIQNSAGSNLLTADTVTGNVIVGGNIGIGNTAPGYLLHVGDASVTSGTSVARFENAGGTCTITPNTAGGISCTSDIRLKKDITNVDSSTSLQKLLGIGAISYHLNAESGTDQLHVGFSAQQLETVLPDLVVTDAQGYKSVSYAGLTPYLVSAIQEQQNQIVAIQASSNNLTNGGTIQGNLAINGNLNLNGLLTVDSLAITGNATFAGDVSVQNIQVANIIINGHIITAGNTPTITAGIAAGTGATAVIDGNDTAGVLTITIANNAAPTKGVISEVTFDKPFDKSPRAVISAKNEATANLKFYQNTETGKFSILLSQPGLAGETYVFDYLVNQ